MKKLLFIITLLFSFNSFSQGVEFEHGTFDEALEKAKAENKMLFMDCYTTWCGPCKAMSKNIFPQKEVGDYFNQHFISIKMDMEKGEGIDLAEKYGVKAFPTLLFMDSNGKVLHTKVGGTDAGGLIAEAKIASDPSKQIGVFDKRYEDGDRDVEFLSSYVKALYAAYQLDKIIEIGEEFLKTTSNEDIINVYAFTVIGYSNALDYSSETYKFIIDNKEKFIAAKGIEEEDYNGIIGQCIQKYLTKVASSGTLEEVKTAIEETQRDFISPLLESSIFETYYLANNEFENWYDSKINQATEMLKANKSAFSMFIQTAYIVAVDPKFTNAGLDKRAIKDIEKLTETNKDISACYYCLAYLYKKIGDKEAALKNINIGISISKEKEGEEDPRINKLKKEIEAMN